MPKRERPEAAAKKGQQEDGAKKSKADDIDDIFAVKKQRKADDKKQQEADQKEIKKQAAAKKANKKNLTYSRKDVEQMKEKEWVYDGLGGKFNRDGYTGRVEGGVKVFKAHLFNKSGFGDTKDCPFDCKCCFI